MGQKLDQAAKRTLMAHPLVQCVTEEHVVLKDGKVLDPNEFPFTGTRTFLVKKLARCNCSQQHRAGTHVIVEVYGGQTVLGNVVIGNSTGLHPYCRAGEWTVEEVIIEPTAAACGLLDAYPNLCHK